MVIKGEPEGSKKEKKRFIHLFSGRHCAMCYTEMLILNLHITLWVRFYSLHSMAMAIDGFSKLPKVSVLETVKFVLVLSMITEV